jgi:hypothetical protein
MLQVFNRRRHSVGCWLAGAEAEARAELRKHPGGYLLLVDEYQAKLPHWGYFTRVVVGRVSDVECRRTPCSLRRVR